MCTFYNKPAKVTLHKMHFTSPCRKSGAFFQLCFRQRPQCHDTYFFAIAKRPIFDPLNRPTLPQISSVRPSVPKKQPKQNKSSLLVGLWVGRVDRSVTTPILFTICLSLYNSWNSVHRCLRFTDVQSNSLNTVFFEVCYYTSQKMHKIFQIYAVWIESLFANVPPESENRL